MELCATAHPYYSRVMAEQGLSPADFSTVDDLRKLLSDEIYGED